LVSVIIPTRNRATLLSKAISSVLSQTYPNFELIVIDDGSTDTTPEMVNAFKDRRIVYLRYEKGPRGPNFARNIGLSRASGDIITFLDDDDEFLSDALQTIVDAFFEAREHGAKILLFDSICAETNELAGKGLRRKKGAVKYKDILCKAIGDFQTAFDKEAFREIRFEDDIMGFESVTLLELHKRFPTWYFPQIVRRNFTKHGPRLKKPSLEDFIGRLPNTLRAKKRFLKRYGSDLLRWCPKMYWSHLGELGFYQLLHGEKLEGIRNIWKAFTNKGMSKKRVLFALITLPLPSRCALEIYKLNLLRSWKPRSGRQD